MPAGVSGSTAGPYGGRSDLGGSAPPCGRNVADRPHERRPRLRSGVFPEPVEHRTDCVQIAVQGRHLPPQVLLRRLQVLGGILISRRRSRSTSKGSTASYKDSFEGSATRSG